MRSDVMMTATCLTTTREKIATATGCDLFLDPGPTPAIALTGPRPHRSISAVTIDAVTHPSAAPPPIR
jgi:hypothetical protein